MLSIYSIMNVMPSPVTPFIERSEMDLKVAGIASDVLLNQQRNTKDTKRDIRPLIRTNNNNLQMMHRCYPPNGNTSSWRYYKDLVDTNLDTAAKALNLTDNPATTTQQLQQNNNNNNSPSTVMGYSEYIPHRLIFTHTENLFDCSISASNTTSPHLYTLAENAKATVNAYSKIWPDLEVVFLTDQNCLHILNEVEPDLIPFFHKEIGTFHLCVDDVQCLSHISLHHLMYLFIISGMFKADICRAAYLYLYGGYYFDVDVLVVRPFLAGDAKFVTVKGIDYQSNGFFQVCLRFKCEWHRHDIISTQRFHMVTFSQAFLASEKQNSIVGRSIQIMLHALQGKRPKGRLFGPMALLQAWEEEGRSQVERNGTTYDNDGTYLLVEGNANTLNREYSKISKMLRRKKHALSQKEPAVPAYDCEFSGGLCNFVVIDGADETLYFYSRILGTELCGKLLNCAHRVAREHVNAPPCESSLDGKDCYWWPTLERVSMKIECEYSSNWPDEAKNTHNLFDEHDACCRADEGSSRCAG